MQPIVSVVIPTHNRPQLIKKAVLSVLSQTFQQLELIVVNDGSDEITTDILNQLTKSDARILVLTNPLVIGASASRNKGIAASQGEWIAFLDDDDSWRADKLQSQIDHLKKCPQAVAASCAYTIHYPLGFKKTFYPPEYISLENLFIANRLGGSSVCLGRASVLKKIGFDAKLRSAQDWDIWIKLRQVGDILGINQPLVDYYVHFNDRISNNMYAKYAGAKRFYFKYQFEMSLEARKYNLRFICFIRSRQTHRSRKSRLKNLWLALRRNDIRTAFAYSISSFPRLFVTLVK